MLQLEYDYSEEWFHLLITLNAEYDVYGDFWKYQYWGFLNK